MPVIVVKYIYILELKNVLEVVTIEILIQDISLSFWVLLIVALPPPTIK